MTTKLKLGPGAAAIWNDGLQDIPVIVKERRRTPAGIYYCVSYVHVDGTQSTERVHPSSLRPSSATTGAPRTDAAQPDPRAQAGDDDLPWDAMQVREFAKRFARSSAAQAWWALVPEVREALITRFALGIATGCERESITAGEVQKLAVAIERTLADKHRMPVGELRHGVHL